MRPVTILPIGALAAAALAAPVSASAAPGGSYLELGTPVAGASAARRGHEGHIEVQSYAFGAARKGWDGTVKGGSIAAERKGWDGSVKGSGVAAAGPAAPTGQGAKFGAIAGAHRADGLAAGKVSMQDISAPSMTSGPPKASPLTSGRVGDGSAAGAGPGTSAPATGIGAATPKPISHDIRTNVVARTAAPPPAVPPAPGSITVDGNFPGCTVGAAYSGAMLQLAGVRYELSDVQITSCPAARSSMAGEWRTADGLSLNYRKVKVRAWDPEKKED